MNGLAREQISEIWRKCDLESNDGAPMENKFSSLCSMAMESIDLANEVAELKKKITWLKAKAVADEVTPDDLRVMAGEPQAPCYCAETSTRNCPRHQTDSVVSENTGGGE